MAHTARYSFRGTSRLAADAGLAKSTISHLVHGKTNPLYSTVERLVKSFEAQLGCELPCHEVFSLEGTYPTQHVCELVGCKGCLPDIAYEVEGSRRTGFEDVQPGKWTGDVGEFDGQIAERTA